MKIVNFGLLLLLLHVLTAHAGLTVTNIAVGSSAYHSLFVLSDGSLWVMGYNYYGELGDGTFTNASRPEQIVASGVMSVAAGSGHSLFIKTNGSLWAMGQNNYGQLGNGKYSSLPPFGTNEPVEIVSSGVTAIAAGWSQSLFIKTNGSLWAMGENRYGELGDGTLHETNRPEQIVSSGVTAIAVGIYFSLFLKSDGSLWAMGENNNGELGNGTFNNTNRPQLIVSNGVVAIAAGGYHSLFVKSDGSLWAMGANGNGQLGDGTLTKTNQPEQIVSSGVTAVAAGTYHSLFLKSVPLDSSRSLWAMGEDNAGQLGDGNPIFAVKRPEEILASGVTAIAAGYDYSLFLQFGGSLWAMGDNNYGQLGDGNPYDHVFVPEQMFPAPQTIQPVAPSIQLSDSALILTWPTNLTGFTLQSTTNLASQLWATNLPAPVVTNGQNTLTYPISGTQQFFRLSQP